MHGQISSVGHQTAGVYIFAARIYDRNGLPGCRFDDLSPLSEDNWRRADDQPIDAITRDRVECLPHLARSTAVKCLYMHPESACPLLQLAKCLPAADIGRIGQECERL